MQSYKVNSIAEFINYVIDENEKIIKDIKDGKNEKLFFRGQSNEAYELIPALGRNREYEVDISILNYERNLIEMAQNKRSDIFRHDLQPIELLALLQHYGIPTRLLDITENALVALYFACRSHHNEKKEKDEDEEKEGKTKEIDGEVIVFKKNILSIINYPIIQAIADSYRLIETNDLSLRTFYKYASYQPYFTEYKPKYEESFYNKKDLFISVKSICGNDINEEIRVEDKIDNGIPDQLKQCYKTPYLVYAPTRSLRQQAQQGCYLLFSNKIDIADENNPKFEQVIEPLPKGETADQDQSIRKTEDRNNADDVMISAIIKIPAEAKTNILGDLKLFGISEQTLFPDNIDKMCEGITKEFEVL